MQVARAFSDDAVGRFDCLTSTRCSSTDYRCRGGRFNHAHSGNRASAGHALVDANHSAGQWLMAVSHLAHLAGVLVTTPPVETFKLSSDPFFVEKVRDIVGLYLNPPERALVLCVDEKSQIQALDRTRPILPLRPGVPARQSHDYVRNGTTSLFAALDVATGKVVASF